MITSLQQYQGAFDAIHVEVDNECANIEESPEILREFLNSSVNLHRFFPEKKHDDLAYFKKVLVHNKLKVLERHIDFETLVNGKMKIEGDLEFLTNVGKKPYIFASFHYGILGAIVTYLISVGFEISMLSAAENDTNGSAVHEQANDEIEVLDVSSVDVMIKLVHSMRSNKCIFGLMDGIWGVNKDEERKSFSKVNLMNHSFLFKKGISMLSYATGAQIVPVVCKRDTESGMFVIRFEKPIEVSRKLDKNNFIETSLQKCFNVLEEYLQENPDQWDFWNNCHQFIDKNSLPQKQIIKPTIRQMIIQFLNKGSYKFNYDQFDICMGGIKNYLFKKENQSCFAISNNLSKFLKHLPIDGQKMENVKKQINKKILTDLIKKKVLIPAYS
jgi:lauroyl/myristoyl acyltransferase